MGTLTTRDEANSSLGQGPYTHNLHPRCQSQPATSRSRRSPSSSAICCLGLGSTCSRLLLLVSRWRSRRPPWQPTEVIPLLLLWPEFGVEVVFLASTKVSSHGPGLKPPRRALSSSLLPPRENTTLVPSALVTSPLESAVVSWEVSHSYATMGFCTCMKTVEITKTKLAATGVKPPGTFATFMDIYRKEGIKGINKGVNVVAIRQMTNWGSRFGLSRLAEQGIRSVTGKKEGGKLSAWEKILASGLGGGLSAWNQPIEVIRVEMQSKTVDPNRPAKMTVGNTAKYIYQNNGIKGLYRGVVPRIGL